MNKKYVIVIFCLLMLFSCKKAEAQKTNTITEAKEFLGTWVWENNTENENKNSTFSININKIKGDSIFGQYCAVAREGRKIGCSNEVEYNLKGVMKGGILKTTFYSFFNAKNGTAELSLKDNKLLWQIIIMPKGECYAQKKCELKKNASTSKSISNDKSIDFVNFFKALPKLSFPIYTKSLKSGKGIDKNFLNYDYDKTYFSIQNFNVIGGYTLNDVYFILYNFSLLGEGEGFQNNVILLSAYDKKGSFLNNLVISGSIGGEGSADIYESTINADKIITNLKQEYYESSTGLNYIVKIEKNQIYVFDNKLFILKEEKYECKNSNLDSYYSQIKNAFMKKNTDIIMSDYALRVKLYVSCNPISLNNISKYNDIGYYLEQAGAYEESIFVLNKILKNESNRVVAYLNLADAYWGNGDKEEAKKSYQKYISLMKSQGKDIKKIPQRVYERSK